MKGFAPGSQKARLFRHGAVLLLFPMLLASVFGARDASYNDTKGEGNALVQEILTSVPGEDSQILGLLKIRPNDGPIKEVPIRMTVKTVEGGWDDVYETQPVKGRPGEVFIVKHRGTNPNEYLFGTYATIDEKPNLKKLSLQELYQPLAGSDFFLMDLSLGFLHWPSQKIVKKEMRKSRSCRVVESINPEPNRGPYRRVLTWIDFETNGIILAEAYDQKGEKLKEFSIQKFDRKEKRLREMRIMNDQTESRTTLELNFKVEK